MRIISLDTETTGLNPEKGDKITEIGCIEIINRKITENIFHTYLNPEREVSDAAKAITGLELKFLKNKPKFEEKIDELLKFLDNSDKIIIHNADFDINFINSELNNINHNIKSIEKNFTIFDTLKFARKIHPGKKNSIDALCNRYKIRQNRTLHGALIDAELLAKIFLNLTTGQDNINIKVLNSKKTTISIKKNLKIINANDDEIYTHNKYMSIIKKKIS